MVFHSRKNAISDADVQQQSSSSPESKSPKKRFGFGGRKHIKKGVVIEVKNDEDDEATAPMVISYVKVQEEIDPVIQSGHIIEKKAQNDSAMFSTGGQDECCSTLDTFYEIFFGGEEDIDIIECNPPCGVDDDNIECTTPGGCSPTFSGNNDSFGTVATSSCSPWSVNSSWNPNFFQEEETEGAAGNNAQCPVNNPVTIIEEGIVSCT